MHASPRVLGDPIGGRAALLRIGDDPRVSRSARSGPLMWKVIRGSASRLRIHERVRREGRPLMISRPSMLWKTISSRRGRPVRRPVVVMSMSPPRSRSRRMASDSAAVRGDVVGCMLKQHTPVACWLQVTSCGAAVAVAARTGSRVPRRFAVGRQQTTSTGSFRSGYAVPRDMRPILPCRGNVRHLVCFRVCCRWAARPWSWSSAALRRGRSAPLRRPGRVVAGQPLRIEPTRPVDRGQSQFPFPLFTNPCASPGGLTTTLPASTTIDSSPIRNVACPDSTMNTSVYGCRCNFGPTPVASAPGSPRTARRCAPPRRTRANARSVRAGRTGRPRPSDPEGIVAEHERGSLVGHRLPERDPSQRLEIVSRGAPGANRISIDASAPDSFRKPWIPPSGTYRKSPGRASNQSRPSNSLIDPEITKNDSEIVRWKCGPARSGPATCSTDRGRTGHWSTRRSPGTRPCRHSCCGPWLHAGRAKAGIRQPVLTLVSRWRIGHRDLLAASSRPGMDSRAGP